VAEHTHTRTMEKVAIVGTVRKLNRLLVELASEIREATTHTHTKAMTVEVSLPVRDCTTARGYISLS